MTLTFMMVTGNIFLEKDYKIFHLTILVEVCSKYHNCPAKFKLVGISLYFEKLCTRI